MLKHKVGDIVTLNDKVDSDIYKYFKSGIQVKIRELCLENTDDEHYTVHLLTDYDRVWWIKDYEIEEGQVFNIKTDPWFIRVNSEQESKAAQDWLFEQGIMWIHSVAQHKYTEYGFILNTFREGSISKHLLRTNDPAEIHPKAKEIKLTFKITIDSAEYPVVKSKEQIKIEELQATIDRACKEIKELREMGEKK